MRFSNRTPDDLSYNAIAKALEAGKNLIDLTQSNPTEAGFNYPKDLLSGLSSPAALRYEPQAFGSLSARKTLGQVLAKQGWLGNPDNLILTASTSEAYSYLFKLLGNPGDAFLVPTPGYPLLDHLLALEGLDLIPYPFKTEAGWPIDQAALQTAVTPETKGLVTVNPHNPTGSLLSQADEAFIGDFCAQHELAYISDEVFSDYLYQPRPKANLNPKVLSFRMGGLSKSLGLPQLKLSWMEMTGPEKLVQEAKARLELIADTYLSVNTPVQVGLESLLAFGPTIQKQILDRVLANRKTLEAALKDLANLQVWPAQGGWYALVEIKKPQKTEEQMVLALIEKHRVSVQPGSFYDFPKGCFLVVSLLPQPDLFGAGAERLKKYFT